MGWVSFFITGSGETVSIRRAGRIGRVLEGVRGWRERFLGCPEREGAVFGLARALMGNSGRLGRVGVGMRRFDRSLHTCRCDRRDSLQASLNGTGLALF